MATAFVDTRLFEAVNQSRLAHDVGLSRSYISLIFRGKRNPKLSVAARIARHLNVSLDQLVLYQEAQRSLN
jgi:transcriptional regulator with XRE-family HTH domain